MSPSVATQSVAVLDMGASAIRLVVAESPPMARCALPEEASRAVLLGRDTFASNTIRPERPTPQWRRCRGSGGSSTAMACSRCAPWRPAPFAEARNADAFLDRIRTRTGISFDIINEAEESRLAFLAVQHSVEPRSRLRR